MGSIMNFDNARNGPPMTVGDEKRLHPRKKVSLPAFVVVPGSHAVHPAMIQDISSGGLRISVSKESGVEMGHFDRRAHLSILFTLPQEKASLGMSCVPSRVRDNDEEIEVGAFFAASDVAGSQQLRNFLSA
jgi:hypothetical protein